MSNTAVSFATRVLALAALPLLFACSPVGFSQSPEKVGANGVTDPNNPGGPNPETPPVCSDIGAIQRQTKIIFVVDTSGSNVVRTRDGGMSGCDPEDPDYATCNPATDPIKAFRGGAIQNFFSTYKHKSNFDWGFLVFGDINGSASSSLINPSLGLNSYISGSASQMQGAIDSFYRMEDYGPTPFASALKLARGVVMNDPDLKSNPQAQYVVIFISDGFPTDYYDDLRRFDSQSLNDDIASLLAISPGRVSLSTIYYGTRQDPTAVELLKAMAAKGTGQFANVNVNNTSLKIDDVIPGQVCK